MLNAEKLSSKWGSPNWAVVLGSGDRRIGSSRSSSDTKKIEAQPGLLETSSKEQGFRVLDRHAPEWSLLLPEGQALLPPLASPLWEEALGRPHCTLWRSHELPPAAGLPPAAPFSPVAAD